MTDPKIPLQIPPEIPQEATEEGDSSTSDSAPAEIGGRKGPDPTRYGDWEIGGKCVDF